MSLNSRKNHLISMSVFSLLILLVASNLFNFCSNPRTYKDEIDQKIDDLIARMTLEEKVGQLVQYSSQWEMTGPVPEASYDLYEKIKSGKVGSMLNVTGVEAVRIAQQIAVNESRLGIPLIFGYDVIHGYKTIFPIPLGEAATWQPELAKLSSVIAAREASASGINWTFAPMVDVSRDARWGRVMEGSGEDTYLQSVFAVARVKGFQGNNLASDSTIAACAKHFAGYGFAESGKDYNTTDMSDYTLHNVILPPFKACVDAGVATIMNGFNEIGGMPVTASKYLQRDILKGEWGFKGFVVSDWNSIGELITHGVAEDKKAAARLAILAGSDMDMEGDCYTSELVNLVKSGEVDESALNESVRRILRVKFDLGLFDDPYFYCNAQREKERVDNPEYLPIARDIARRSLVLLKNEGDILPLPATGKKIAVIGELAADKDSPLGSWRAMAARNSAVSVLEGIQNLENAGIIVEYAKGPDYVIGETAFHIPLLINEHNTGGLDQAISLAKRSDVVIVVLGEHCYQTGESKSQSDIRMKGLQELLVKKLREVNENLVMVLMNGRPMDLSPVVDDVKAILVTWHAGSQSGNAIADVLFGKYNPSGKLPVSFPRNVGQMPLYYNHKQTGRPAINQNMYVSNYQDVENSPLFPFGFGMSYTTFSLSGLQLSAKEIRKEDSLRISATIINTGTRYGEEVVQLYVQDLYASLARPVKELKRFQKIGLSPGEKQSLIFDLSKEDLAFYTANKKWETEPGTFKIWLGTSSEGGLEAEFCWLEK